MIDHGLTARQLEIIKLILVPYSDKIEKVGLFGSRATGAYRENSDIDMVIYGDMDEQYVSHLWTLLNESSLPVKVDVNAYNLIAYPPLKEHIDSNVKMLFTKQDLIVTN
jgi:predicted nucleotidyltransferase